MRITSPRKTWISSVTRTVLFFKLHTIPSERSWAHKDVGFAFVSLKSPEAVAQSELKRGVKNPIIQVCSWNPCQGNQCIFSHKQVIHFSVGFRIVVILNLYVRCHLKLSKLPVLFSMLLLTGSCFYFSCIRLASFQKFSLQR